MVRVLISKHRPLLHIAEIIAALRGSLINGAHPQNMAAKFCDVAGEKLLGLLDGRRSYAANAHPDVVIALLRAIANANLKILLFQSFLLMRRPA